MTALRACVLLTAVLTLAAAPVPTGPRVWKGHDGQVAAVQFSPDGKLVASAGLDGKILLREALTGKQVAAPKGHEEGAYAVAFAPDGKTLVSAGADGVVRAWDLSTGKETRSFSGHKGKVAAVAFSRDGKRLASGGYDGVIILWDPLTGKETRRLKGHKCRVTALAFTPDAKRLISGGTTGTAYVTGGDNRIGTGVADGLFEWDLETGAAQRLSGRGSSLAVTADGKMVAGGGLYLDVQRKGKGVALGGLTSIFLIEEKTGKELHQIQWRGEAVAFSPDGKVLASGRGSYLHLDGFGVMHPNGRDNDDRIHLWETDSARQRMRLPQDDATVLAFSPDGKFLVAGNYHGALTFWDLKSERRNPTPDPAEIITPPPPGDKLLVGLHADFESLLVKEKNPAALRAANKLLNQTNRSDRWTYYFEALALLRKERPRAGIPLLLRYMVEHTEQGSPAEYANTLSILTGEDRFTPPGGWTGPGADRREHVQKVVDTWWRPNKDRITTDFGRMSDRQIQVVFSRLVKSARRHLRNLEEDNPAGPVRSLLRALEYDRDYQPWHGEDLHAAMLPLLLAEARYQEKPGPKAARESHAIPYALVPLLADLRQKGEAQSLDRIAADERQSSATRLTCLLAMHGAGVPLGSGSVRAILDAEKKLERRIVAIRLLGVCRDRDVVRPHLIRLLDDPNVHVRTAALDALTAVGPAGALGSLKKLLEEGDPREANRTILSLLVKINTPEARQVLADVLAKALEGGRRSRIDLSLALSTFEEATGKKWRVAGAHPEASQREAARQALRWWKEQQGRGSLEADLEAMLKGEEIARDLREAARQLDDHRNGGATWVALKDLRRGRSKAAVPLLLTALIKHHAAGLRGWRLQDYADTVTILTGREISSDVWRDPNALEKGVRAWWAANRDTITTDPGKMSRGEVRLMVRKLLEQWDPRYALDPSGGIRASGCRRALDGALHFSEPDRPFWWKEELHPVMLPFLLAGDDAPAVAKGGKPAKDRSTFPYAAIPMLAALYEDGDAPDLKRLAVDATQTGRTRLLCLLALFRAGERLTSPALVGLLDKETDLECRLIAILALGRCHDQKACGSKLASLLDGPDAEIQMAAVIALRRCPSEKALPTLETLLKKKDPHRVPHEALEAITAIGSTEAQEALARYLDAAVTSKDRMAVLSSGLHAFEQVTGTRWTDGGPHDDDAYLKKARLALDWWKKR
jgi:WD40 repeat protein/HEAT repeat protein